MALTRRKFVSAASVATIVGVAGCAGDDAGEDDGVGVGTPDNETDGAGNDTGDDAGDGASFAPPSESR